MKKRIEKVVERTESSRYLTIGKKYIVHSESEMDYLITDDDGDKEDWDKSGFKVVSEREVLEFEGDQIANFDNIFDVRVFSEIDLTNYDLKVIATPKDKDIEYWKNNAKDGYDKTPICVLRYITELEELLKSKE